MDGWMECSMNPALQDLTAFVVVGISVLNKQKKIITTK